MKVVHADPVEQAGHIQIPNAVALRTDLSIAARFLYGYLKTIAWRSPDSEIETTQDSIREALGFGKNALTGYLRELQAAKLLTVERRGQGLPSLYKIQNPRIPETGSQDAPEIPDSEILESRKPGVSPCLLDLELEDPPIVPPTTRLPGKVGGKSVRPEEATLAVAVLAEWNAQTGQSLTSPDWLSKIVMRLREHPELVADDHAHLIQAALADPWWTGAASPSVVYGNGALFERMMETARAGPQRKKHPRKWGYGVTADEILDSIGADDDERPGEGGSGDPVRGIPPGLANRDGGQLPDQRHRAPQELRGGSGHGAPAASDD